MKRNVLHMAFATFWTIFALVSTVNADGLTLKSCLEKALAGNPLVTEAGLGVKAGEAAVAGSRGKQFPRLALDLAYSRRQDPVPYIPAQSSTIPAHFSNEFASWTGLLTLPIYQGGQLSAGVALAEVRRDIADLALTQTKNDLIANTVNTFNKLLQLQHLRDASRASIAALEEQIKNTQLLLNLGRAAKIDLLKVNVQLANEQQRLLTLDEAIATTGATLHYLMGDAATENEPLLLWSPPVVDITAAAVAGPGNERPWSNRPEYRSAFKAVEEADISQKISQGKVLPSVNAISGYTDQYGEDPWHNEGNWFLGLQVSMPLFDRALYADLTREKILQDKAAAHLKAVENQLRLEVGNAAASLRESGGRVATAERVIEQAHESFRIEQQKYTAGAGVMSDLLLAQAADMTAEANLSQARFDRAAALVAWRRATGMLEEYLK